MSFFGIKNLWNHLLFIHLLNEALKYLEKKCQETHTCADMHTDAEAGSVLFTFCFSIYVSRCLLQATVVLQLEFFCCLLVYKLTSFS